MDEVDKTSEELSKSSYIYILKKAGNYETIRNLQ